MKQLLLTSHNNNKLTYKNIHKVKIKKIFISHIRRFEHCGLTYMYSISETKKRFLKGKCKKMTHSKKNNMLHIISKYFSMVLLTKFPIFSPKCISVDLAN